MVSPSGTLEVPAIKFRQIKPIGRVRCEHSTSVWIRCLDVLEVRAINLHLDQAIGRVRNVSDKFSFDQAIVRIRGVSCHLSLG